MLGYLEPWFSSYIATHWFTQSVFGIQNWCDTQIVLINIHEQKTKLPLLFAAIESWHLYGKCEFESD